MLKQFGENLKRLRVEKNISQEEMAKKIKVHANHVSRYERGLSAPSIEVVEKMAKLLDISIDELVFGSVSERMEKNIYKSIATTSSHYLFFITYARTSQSTR